MNESKAALRIRTRTEGSAGWADGAGGEALVFLVFMRRQNFSCIGTIQYHKVAIGTRAYHSHGWRITRMTGQDRAIAASLTALDDHLLDDIGVSRVQIWQAARRTKMRPIASSFAALAACLSLAAPSLAQPANPPTPTTRILAIGTVNRGVDPARVG